MTAGRRDSLTTIVVVFAVVFGLFEAAIWGATVAGLLVPLMEATAKVAAVLIGSVGIPVTRSGIQLILPSHILEIDLDCTALPLIALYAALILAYPVSVRTKLIGLAVGVPLILVVNQLRLLAVAVAAENLSQPLFAFAHDFLFKVVMALVVFALWGWWLGMARRHGQQA